MPQTRTVSIRAFRENMTKFFREANEQNIHFVVMRHAEPIAHIIPVKKKTRKGSLEELMKHVAQARRDIKEGRVYSADEVREMLGL